MTEYELYVRLCAAYDLAKNANDVDTYVAINSIIVDRWGRDIPYGD